MTADGRPPVPELPATPEVSLGGSAADATRMPGAPRASFDRLPTAPLPAQPPTGPGEDGSGTIPLPQWMEVPEAVRPHRGLAAWALFFAIAGLAVSFVVGWGFPLGLIAIVTAAVALRRPLESRALAGWALALGIVSVLFSAGWLLWAATRMNLFG